MLRVRCLDAEGEFPAGKEKATFHYAIRKNCGNAVLRNRVRRRLRAALRSEEFRNIEPHHYLIIADSFEAARPFDELRRLLCQLIEKSSTRGHKT